MIAHIRRATTREPDKDKDTYCEHLPETGLRDYAAVQGNRRVWILVRPRARREAEFLLMSLGESYEAIQAFADRHMETPLPSP
jgi:hypothetical protein